MSKADVRPGGKYLPAALFNVERVTARGIARVASDVPLEAAQQAVACSSARQVTSHAPAHMAAAE